MFRYLIFLINLLIKPFLLIKNMIAGLFLQKNKSEIELKIIGTGIYLPEKQINNYDMIINKPKLIIEIIKRYNKKNKSKLLDYNNLSDNDKQILADFIYDYYGTKYRYIANTTETNSYMGAEAIKNACLNANINTSQIDLIINASGTIDEIIPDTSVKIHNLLNLQNTSAFTIHSTCMSFMYALNVANSILKSDPNINTIAIVSSEKTSLTVNPSEPKTYLILGDIATAIILTKEFNVNQLNRSMITNAKFKTYSEYCNNIKCATGNIRHPSDSTYNSEDYYFKMDSFNLVNKIPEIFRSFSNEILFTDYEYIVVHQPSKMALEHLMTLFPKNKIVHSFEEISNCVSACIPYNLHKLIHEKKINRGTKILLFGIGAGINIGAINLVY
jgi:3-oxoacyl-[acyl-carrier-protein] synthase-3